MKGLTKAQVLSLHKELISRFGGAHGVRDFGLLSSALGAPLQTFAGQELYRSDLDKAAKLGHSLICNHVFVDGNKRIGVLAMMTLMELNGIRATYTHDELVSVVISVAAGELDYDGWLAWWRNHVY